MHVSQSMGGFNQHGGFKETLPCVVTQYAQ